MPSADDEALPNDYNTLHEMTDEMADGVDEDRWNAQPTVRTFANDPVPVETYVHADVSMWNKSGLPPRGVEHVMLATGREMDSTDECHDHVIKAIERAGMSREGVLAIAEKDTSAMDDSTAALGLESEEKFVGWELENY